MVEFTANDIVLLVGAISGGVCAILKLSRCEQINICGFLAFKRRTNTTSNTNTTNTNTLNNNNNMTRTPSIETINNDSQEMQV